MLPSLKRMSMRMDAVVGRQGSPHRPQASRKESDADSLGSQDDVQVVTDSAQLAQPVHRKPLEVRRAEASKGSGPSHPNSNVRRGQLSATMFPSLRRMTMPPKARNRDTKD